MRLDTVSVRGGPATAGDSVVLRLGRAVTVLTGPDPAAAAGLLRAVTLAIDERAPVSDRESVDAVVLGWDDRAHGRHDHVEVAVSWSDGVRVVDIRADHGAVDVDPGCVVVCWAADRPADVLARLADVLATEQVDALAADLLPTVRRILPEVHALELPDGPGGPVRAADEDGEPVPEERLRVAMAAALAAHLVRVGIDIAAVVVESPERDLPDGSLSPLRDEMLEVAVAADAPVVCVTGSEALIADDPDVSVVRVTTTPDGRTVLGVHAR